MVPLCKSSCSNLQASEITLYMLCATYWKETQNMPLFSPNPFSFSNILTDKVEVFWTRVYRQAGYSFMFISRPTFNRSTQYTSHILSLPSNKLTYSSRRQNGLQTTNIFTKTLVQTKDGCFEPSIITRGVCVVRRPTWTSDAQSECRPTRFTDSLYVPQLDPHRSPHPRKKTDPFPKRSHRFIYSAF